jgi:nucleoside-diphosphate-sugar epimerase
VNFSIMKMELHFLICCDKFYPYVQPEMADFEVRGALNVVEACANTSVKRLVLTSSLSAMVWDQQRSVEKVIDEKCWSNLDLCRSKKVSFSSQLTWLVQ